MEWLRRVVGDPRTERQAEREIIDEETAPLAREIKGLRAEVEALRMEIAARLPRAAQ